jgi:DNA polymerase-4
MIHTPETWRYLGLRWLYLDLNSYFASVEQQLNPALRHRPVAVVPVLSDTTCAIAASYEAKAFGVKTGTPIYEAKKMCPGLICVQAKHENYVDFHHRIMEEIDKHIPIEIVASIDEVACQLMGPQCEAKEAIAIAERIKAGLRRNIGPFVRCSIGIASNRFLAKVATDLDKPDGLFVVDNRKLPQSLSPLKLGDLPGIGHSIGQRLNRVGIHTIEQLWTLLPGQMRHIWGNVAGERFWYIMRGIEISDLETKRSTVGHSHVLAPEWRPVDKAKIVAHRLLLKAATRLRRLGFYAQDMDLGLRVENGPRLRASCRFYRSCDNIALTNNFMAMWDGLMERYTPRRLKKVSVTLHNLIAGDKIQPELFDADQNMPQRQIKRNESVSLAMDQLNARYGRDTIVMGTLPQESHSFSGTKIAFTRIPDKKEFYE